VLISIREPVPGRGCGRGHVWPVVGRPISVQYSGAYTGYGPITASAKACTTWSSAVALTMRPDYMPESRDRLRGAPRHKMADQVAPFTSDGSGNPLMLAERTVLEREADGMQRPGLLPPDSAFKDRPARRWSQVLFTSFRGTTAFQRARAEGRRSLGGSQTRDAAMPSASRSRTVLSASMMGLPEPSEVKGATGPAILLPGARLAKPSRDSGIYLASWSNATAEGPCLVQSLCRCS